MQYGKLLTVESSVADAKKFMLSDFTDKIVLVSEEFPDANGNNSKLDRQWAEFVIVESKKWTQEHTDIIYKAVVAYNKKYPANPITTEQKFEMIW